MKRTDEQGFSLIELVVVLAIMGIMAAAIPVASGYGPVLEIDRGSRALAQELREARADAVKYGNDVIVAFDPSTGTIDVYNDQDRDGPQLADLIRRRTLTQLSGGGVVFAVATATGVDGGTVVQPVKMGASSAPIAVTFRANGAAVNSGTAYLSHLKDGRVEMGRAIQVLSTGKVELWRYDAAGSPGPWRKWI